MMPISDSPGQLDYFVAGAWVRTNRECALASTGHSDFDLRILFATDGETENTLLETARLPGSGWIEIRDNYPVEAWLRGDGKLALICSTTTRPGETARHIRRVVPFAAGLQGKITLHASAVMVGDQVVAFLGASGVGKSTLSRALRSVGYRRVADDLLPIRFERERPMALVTADTLLKPLTALYFLSRRARLHWPSINPIDGREYLRLLIYNGFGEIRQRNMWADQFRVYGQLARNPPGYELMFPEDLNALSRHLPVLENHFRQLLTVNKGP